MSAYTHSYATLLIEAFNMLTIPAFHAYPLGRKCDAAKLPILIDIKPDISPGCSMIMRKFASRLARSENGKLPQIFHQRSRRPTVHITVYISIRKNLSISSCIGTGQPGEIASLNRFQTNMIRCVNQIQ